MNKIYLNHAMSIWFDYSQIPKKNLWAGKNVHGVLHYVDVGKLFNFSGPRYLISLQSGN